MTSSALEDLADAADDVAGDQRRIARAARTMRGRRERGWSWAAMLDHEGSPGVVELLRRSGRVLAAATARFTRAVAVGLVREGESHRRTARRLGVSRQRVSALLNHDRDPGRAES